ncbi:MAG: hypothetical protein M1837_001333 [Sclerophora amabilis]|nr:MAG: hypothetical protein M1837_001333 [Sclerophora amabilis]
MAMPGQFPPAHHGPPPPGPQVHGIQQQMNAMNLGGAKPAHKAQEVIDLTPKPKQKSTSPDARQMQLEGWTFRREEPAKGERRTWLKVRRAEMALPFDELHKQVKQQERGGASLYHKYRKLAPNQLAQVDRLIDDKKKAERDPNVEWKLACLNAEKKKGPRWGDPVETSVIIVILKRESRTASQSPAGAKATGPVLHQEQQGGPAMHSFPGGGGGLPPAGQGRPSPGPNGPNGPNGPPQMAGGLGGGPPPPPMHHLPAHMRPQNQGQPPKQGGGNQPPVVVVGGASHGQSGPAQHGSAHVNSRPSPPPGVIQFPPGNMQKPPPPPIGVGHAQQRAPPPPPGPSGSPGQFGHPGPPMQPKGSKSPHRRSSRDFGNFKPNDRVTGWVDDIDDSDGSSWDQDTDSDSEETGATSLGSMPPSPKDFMRRNSGEIHRRPGLPQTHSSQGPVYRDHRRPSFDQTQRHSPALDAREEVLMRSPRPRHQPSRGLFGGAALPAPYNPRRGSFHDDRLVSTRHPPHDPRRMSEAIWPDQLSLSEGALLQDQITRRNRDREMAIRSQIAREHEAEALARRQGLYRSYSQPYGPVGYRY